MSRIRAPEPNPLPHTTKVTRLLKAGKREVAISHHNVAVKRAMADAQAGKTVCLTDLMAAKETLVIDQIAGG